MILPLTETLRIKTIKENSSREVVNQDLAWIA